METHGALGLQDLVEPANPLGRPPRKPLFFRITDCEENMGALTACHGNDTTYPRDFKMETIELTIQSIHMFFLKDVAYTDHPRVK